MRVNDSFMFSLVLYLISLLAIHLIVGLDIISTQAQALPTNLAKLKIAVPPKAGFTGFVKVDKDPVTGEQQFGGLSIEVFKQAVSATVEKSITFEFIPYAKPDGTMNGTYDDMLNAVFAKDYFGAVGDITIRFSRTQWVDFTVPYTDTGVSMLIPIHQPTNKNAVISMVPMMKGLVIGTLVVFFLGVAVIFAVEVIKFQSGKPKARNDAADWKGETLTAIQDTRLMMVLCFLVVLYLITCFAASLTSLVTKASSSAPNKSLNQLIRTGAKVGYSRGSFTFDLLKQRGLSEKQLLPYDSEAELQDMLSQGRIVVAIHETPYLSVFLAQHCNDYTIVPIPSLRASGFAFAFQKGSRLVQDVSLGIIKMIDNGQLGAIENRTIGNSCDMNSRGDDSNFVNSNTLRTVYAGAIISGILVVIIYIHIIHSGTICNKQRRINQAQRS